MKNLCGKSRKVNDPYEIYVLPDTVWEWRVLKKWQGPENEAKNQYARWFCAVRGDGTFGGYDMGDTYVCDILGTPGLVKVEDVAAHVANDRW